MSDRNYTTLPLEWLQAMARNGQARTNEVKHLANECIDHRERAKTLPPGRQLMGWVRVVPDGAGSYTADGFVMAWTGLGQKVAQPEGYDWQEVYYSPIDLAGAIP